MKFRGMLMAGAIAAAAIGTGSAQAAVVITVDKSTQQMTVEVDGATRWQWKVSTGRSGHDTPAGTFKATMMDVDHYSKKYDNAPMPHSIFFTNSGHAIHGSFAVRRLGTPASHGCVRVEPANAPKLFALVGQPGMKNTTSASTGTAAEARARKPAPATPAAATAPDVQPAPAAVKAPDSEPKIQAAPLTVTPQPPAQPVVRQAFLPNAEPPLPPPGFPPFPRPWSVSSDLR